MAQDEHEVETRLRSDIEAYHASALLYVAVKLGLPDRMGDRHWTAEDLAQKLGLLSSHLERFMRGLCTLGLCEEHPDRTLTLTTAGQSLRSDAASLLREKVMIVVEQYWRPWAELVQGLKTGNPAFEHVFGMPIGAWRRDNAEQGAIFNSYLAKETFAQAGEILAVLDLDGVATIADIGGGHGGLVAAILRARADVAGILFDRRETIEGAGVFLDSVGVGDRVQRVGGDLLAAISVRADLYLLKGVLQQWADAKVRTILRNCRSAMPNNARLIIIERLLPERAAADAAAIMLDLHMMAISGGRVRRLAEFETLLSHAGLALSKMTSTRSGLSLIEAIPS